MRFKSKLSFGLLIIGTITIIFTRFYGLDWGSGYYFHPDENNMAAAVERLKPGDLDPKFYAYGQFPLYLAYFSLRLLSKTNSFSNSVYALRFWSALFSCFTIVTFYFLSRKFIKNQKVTPIFVFLLIFNPGLIQLAHFGTTESLLILVFTLNLYFGLSYLSRPRLLTLAAAGAVSGFGLGAKITTLSLMTPIFLAQLTSFCQKRKITQTFSGFLVFMSIVLIVMLISSPYNLKHFSAFRSAMKYETEVAAGVTKVFYTRQFLHTPPYWFQITRIFPYVNGLPLYIVSFFGLFSLLKNKKSLFMPHFGLIIFAPVLFYFLYFGQLYAKWTRFVSPIFFIFPLLAAFLISRIKNPLLVVTILIICLIPGFLYFGSYFSPDIRLQASNWLKNNLPPQSVILSEAGNVLNLPLNGDFSTTNLDLYNLDANSDIQSQLTNQLAVSNYLLIPSRRIFKNQSNPDFPISFKYYSRLFSGQLGFSLLKTFVPFGDFILNSENAEETWSVFDRPTIRLFASDHHLTATQYQDLLKVGYD